MQTFAFSKSPVVPPHCLWVSGLLLESGSRASAGVPRLYRARHAAGNRLAMGDKVPGAWGAPGTDPLPGMAPGFAMLWAGVKAKPSVTAQLPMGCMVLRSPASLLAGAFSHEGMHDLRMLDAVHAHAGGDRGLKCETQAPVLCGVKSSERGHSDPSAAGKLFEKARVMFIPKPDPWKGTQTGGGKNPNTGRPISFCRKTVTLSHASNPGR